MHGSPTCGNREPCISCQRGVGARSAGPILPRSPGRTQGCQGERAGAGQLRPRPAAAPKARCRPVRRAPLWHQRRPRSAGSGGAGTP
eukprot:2835422-Lingulodinium_polyedra.AAC.1